MKSSAHDDEGPSHGWPTAAQCILPLAIHALNLRLYYALLPCLQTACTWQAGTTGQGVQGGRFSAVRSTGSTLSKLL